jgi:pimeloyl-ACP methyl ester carboxylesterase
MTGVAQELKDVQAPREPLLLKSRGSFLVGGESVLRTPTELSSIFGTPPTNSGHITVNQMYVEYMVPMWERGVPVVMLHGATLSGKSYDTTPDGRIGWFEYFVRKGHRVYIPDQVTRARSGVDLSIYNDVRAGVQPPSALPSVFRMSDEINWTTFRFGPKFGTSFPDEQFPISAAGEFSKQAVPDLNAFLPTPNANFKTMADLAVQLKGAVLMGHSEAGELPLEAALTDPTGVKGLILLEPGSCKSTVFTDQQIAALATKPILVEFGDHLDNPTGNNGFLWTTAYNDCLAFVARVNAAHGRAEMLHPPLLGIRGNSHMIMQDKNNLQIADLILKWIDQNTRGD